MHPLVYILPFRWESDRLQMQKSDLEEKWREIQQTKLSKENQRVLVETSQTSRSQEFAALDRINKQKEAFHQKRLEELDITLASIIEMTEEKEDENNKLREEVRVLEREVLEQEEELDEMVRREEEERKKVRMSMVMKKNRLTEQLREQTELLHNLQYQVQAFVTKTYPTLGS